VAIALVADRGEDGVLGAQDRSNDGFTVERKKIFVRPAAARQDDRVNTHLRCCIDRIGDIDLGALSLHSSIDAPHLDESGAFAHGLKEIFDAGAPGSRDDGYALRKVRERALARSVKKSLGGQALAQRFELRKKRAGSSELQLFDDQLVLALRRVSIKFSSTNDFVTIVEKREFRKSVRPHETLEEIGVLL